MKSRLFYRLVVLIIAGGLIFACAPAAPTAAPTKPAAAPTAAPAAAPTKPAAAPPTAAPTAAPKPAAPTATAAPKVKRGGTLLYANPGGSDNNAWDPLLHNSGNSMHELPVFETPLRWDLVDPRTGRHELRGELAEKWEIKDPKTIILDLRKGVKFHDGTDFNAQTMKWTFEREKTHPKSTGKGYIVAISSMEATDPYTIKINLNNPSATILANLTRAAGGSGSIWAHQISPTAVEKMGEEAFNRKPVATGVMQITEWLPGDRTTLKRFDNHWRKGTDGQNLPYIDGVNARVIVDPAVVLVEMRAGTIQISAHVQPRDFATIRANPDLTLTPQPWSSGRRVFGMNQEVEPFKSNIKLRQAVQYAVDRDSIARIMGFGEGKPNPHIYWMEGNPGYDPKLPAYHYDEAKAAQLVKEAGFPNGLDVELSLYATPADQQAGEMLQSMWAKAGIRAKIEVGQAVAVRAKKKAGNFQMSHWGMTSSLDISHFGRGMYCDGSANWSNYCNPELDKCLAEGDSYYEPEKRAEVYKRCQKIIYDDALIGGTFLIPPAVVQRKEVKGVRFQAYAMDLQEVWIDK